MTLCAIIEPTNGVVLNIIDIDTSKPSPAGPNLLVQPIGAQTCQPGYTYAAGVFSPAPPPPPVDPTREGGSTARLGLAVLVGGTKVVANTTVTAKSRIFLTSQVPGGTPGWLRISARVPGVSFTILSSSAADTSSVAWLMVEAV